MISISKHIICLFFTFYQCITNIYCQSSFQIKVEIDSSGIDAVTANKNGEFAIHFVRPFAFDKRNILVEFTGVNGIMKGFRYKGGLSNYYHVGQSDFSNNKVNLSQRSTAFRSNFLNIDISTGNYWCKRIIPQNPLGYASFTIGENDDLYILNSASSLSTSTPNFYPQQGIVELFKLDSNGSTIWKKGFLFLESTASDTFRIATSGVGVDSMNNIFITGGLSSNSIAVQKQFIAKLDSIGNPVIWKTISNYFPSNMIVSDDGLYFLNKQLYSLSETSWSHEEYALIIKLDHALNLKWAKKYSAINFPYSKATLIKSEQGRLLLTSITEGSYPAIFAELDTDGNIISQKGYANFNPVSKILDDGSLLMASQYVVDDFGNVTNVPVIAKTDTSGNITGCENFPTCLEVSDTTVEFGAFLIEFHPVLDLVDITLEMEPATFSFTPFCDYPPPPIPTFSFPDTLCLGDIATTLSDRNRLAQAREWELSGPGGLDSLLRDSFEFRYTFTEPGEYLLRQSVWVLGCRSDYERSITVLPPLAVAIAADSLLCPDEPQEISASANRTASYIWSTPTGASGQTLPLSASGTYTVTATDGHCEATDSATITVVAGILGNASPFQLPPDTTICHRDLPFVLAPQSVFTDVFYFENGAVQAASYPLTEAGTYKVGMEAFGCDFQQTFRLAVDCHADVYLPTSFSPNGDGINDTFGPLGTDFEVVELSIYDRWGGLRHKSKDAWDGGRAPKGQAGQGVYAYKLVYRDLLNFETVTRQGEVVLVR